MTQPNINSVIADYFASLEISGVRLIMVRNDGILIADSDPDFHSAPLAALCGGAWEAALAMMKSLNPETLANDFRLAFDTASEGLYILPLHYRGKSFYVAGFYCDAINPALLKRQIQLVKKGLVEDLEKKLNTASQNKRTQTSTERQEFLFSEITDEEMDRLFGF